MARRAARTIIGAFALLAAAILAANLYPAPLFAHSARHGAFIIFSDRPIAPAMAAVVADAERRLRTSELYGPEQRFRVFICNSRWRLLLLTRNGTVGGLTDTLLTRNIYIRESDAAANRVIIASGILADAADRPLSYFIAHEATHVMQSRRFGRLFRLRIPRWLAEGHADLIAKGGAFDVATNRALLNAEDPLLSEDLARHGLYRRYHLMVASILARTGASEARLFANPPSEETALSAALGDRPTPGR